MTAYMHPLVAIGSRAVIEKLTIGKLAEATGTKVETIRWYEKAGLIAPPARTSDCGTVDLIAGEHLAEVDRKLADLSALRRELARLISTCEGGTVAECRILEALAPAA